MKKIILGFIAFFTLETNAENNVYIKANIGTNHIKTVNYQNDIDGNIKLKRQFPVVTLGIGCFLEDNLRMDLSLDYYFLFSQIQTTNRPETEFTYATKNYVSLDTKISDLMLNVYKDIPITTKTNIFLMAGGGVSSIKDESYGVLTYNDQQEVLRNAYGKHVYRLAYKLGLGVDYKFHDNIIGEISYAYYDLGKNKPMIIDGLPNITKRSFKVHSFTTGIRIAL